MRHPRIAMVETMQQKPIHRMAGDIVGRNLSIPAQVIRMESGPLGTVIHRLQTGYPCLMDLGRGQDTQELNGQDFPNQAKNTVTGTIAWPHQYLEPIYMLEQRLSGSGHVCPRLQVIRVTNTTNITTSITIMIRLRMSGSFTGAAGTGHGLLSARPSTCTAGPGGTYGTSPNWLLWRRLLRHRCKRREW